MIDLRGKRALVTGAGTRVGAAIATALGAQGMRVAVHHRSSHEGARAVCAAIEAAGGAAEPFAADLADRGAARALVDAVVARFGGLDLLVASAANFERVAFEDVDDAAWDRTLNLNLASPFALVQRARPALREARGAAIFVTCTSATVPYRHYLPYVVAKGAVQKMMRALALELAPEIRVNAVAPGTVLPPEDLDEAMLARLASRALLGRVGRAEDIAEAVVYLAQAPFVTGQELIVDGGRTVAAGGTRSDADDPL
jgi:pteridine reductase